MSGAVYGLAQGYLGLAVLLTAGALLLRVLLAAAERLGHPLSARQAMRAGREVLALAVLLPLLGTAARGLLPAAPLFDFDRSVARHTGRLPAPEWRAPVPARAPAVPSGPALPWAGAALSALAVAAVALAGVRLARHARLLRRLEALPRIRQVGRVAVVVADGGANGGADGGADGEGDGAPAFSAWFPRLGRAPAAWVVVPSALIAEPQALRLTVLHELQHHRQRDTVFAYARLTLACLFGWNPAVRAFSRWLAEAQELACDEALVASGKVQPHAYARCLLDAALRATAPRRLPAVVVGMAHPTLRRIEMLTRYRAVPPRSPLAVVAVAALALAPLTLWAQSASAGRAVSLEQARALAEKSNPAGDLPVLVDAQVLAQVNRLVATPKGRAFMRTALDNLGQHKAALASTLRAKGLPEGLLAVAVIESAVSNLPETSTQPSLAPGLRGAGVWMFIPETARRYGLTVTPERDERLDVARETEAAAALLSDLYGRYHDWRLALAAYNQGEQRVDRVVAETGLRDQGELSRQGRLNDYASTVQAGLLILRNPHLLD